MIFPSYYVAHVLDVISPFYFTWQDMVDMASKLQAGKLYVGSVKAEHILHGSPKLLIHLHILFNAMLQHSFIPNSGFIKFRTNFDFRPLLLFFENIEKNQ